MIGAMPMPAAFKRLDDRILGKHRNRDREREDVVRDDDDEREERDAPPPRVHDGVPKVLATVWRISRLVFLLLGLVAVLAIILIVAPANDDNVIVSKIFELGETVAGPFKDVFTVEDPERMMIVNYALAAAVYFVAASLVTKLPTFSKRG
jgi:hypothetical protein